MSISRIQKMMHEVSKTAEALDDYSKQRRVTFQIIIQEGSNKKLALMAHAAAELALRCFEGDIQVFLKETSAFGNFSDVDTLKDELLRIGKRYGSKKRIHFIAANPDPNLPTIKIGKVDGPGVSADCAGWVAGIDAYFDSDTLAESPAANFAVACAFARVFQSFLMNKTSDRTSWKFDLMHLATTNLAPSNYALQEIPLGEILLLGAGAIGNAYAYVLKYSTNFSSTIRVIDDDHYEEPNHETSMMIGKNTVLAYPLKAKKLSELLQESGRITSYPHIERVDSKSSILQNPCDFLICGVDNNPTRRSLDTTKASCLLNGGTGGSAMDAGHVIVTRHTAADRKLSAYYQSSENSVLSSSAIPSEFNSDECSRLQYQSVSLSAPFIALACGSLLVTACVREKLNIDIGNNYFKIDLFGIQSSLDKRFLKATPVTTSVSSIEPNLEQAAESQLY